jgi:hypothetical protein
MTVSEFTFILPFALAGIAVAILACGKFLVTIGAWVGLLGSVLVIVQIDNRLRIARNDLQHGMSEPLFYAILGLIGVVFLTLLHRGALAFKSIAARLLVVLVHFAAACALAVLLIVIFGVGEGFSFGLQHPPPLRPALEIPPVDFPQTAVRAAIASKAQK